MKLEPDRVQRLKETLEPLLEQDWDEHATQRDPVGLVHQFKDPDSIEIAGIITSCFSYGRQSAFRPLIKRVLDQMGRYPADYVLWSDPKQWERDFSWFKYRFNTSHDLVTLLNALRNVLIDFETVRQAFELDTTLSLRESVGLFVDRMCPPGSSKSYRYLFPHPDKGSACKRLNMFLRWMCREDKIDIGIWKFDTSKLVIPLDTHVSRISKKLGLTVKKGNSWSVAEDITDSLRQLDPLDPLKFDFAICNSGVLGHL